MSLILSLLDVERVAVGAAESGSQSPLTTL
jgi:hypothetical protein